MERVQVNLPATKRFKVHIKPDSNNNEILGWKDDILQVNISAPAIDNKANLELIKFLSKSFKKQVRIVSGLSSRVKFLEFL